MEKNNVEKYVNERLSAATEAVGREAAFSVKAALMARYGAPVYKTGELMRSVAYTTDETCVKVGVLKESPASEYAGFVHEGTHKMRSRPFVYDGVVDAKERLKQAVLEAFES